MPRYDYRCSSCGLEVEVLHGIYENGPQACDVCGGVMRKALSAPAIHFKGSGWAKKDAAATATKPDPKKDSSGAPAAAKTESKGSGAADTSNGKTAEASSGSKPGGDPGAGSGTKAD